VWRERLEVAVSFSLRDVALKIVENAFGLNGSGVPLSMG
jgi:hypothetical protein